MNSFDDEVRQRVEANGSNEDLRRTGDEFMRASIDAKYSYNFSWLGRPVIQYPQDLVAMQELIWTVQPDLIIETGIARGGSLVFLASMLELLAACGGAANGRVIGIDIDIRADNKAAIEQHPMARRITMVQGSSIDAGIVAKVKSLAAGAKRVLVCLDSNHTHDHVLAELQAYAPLVSVGSYCVVFDTIVEDLPADMIHDRPWAPGNNPKTAVHEYLKSDPGFEIDRSVQHKLQITVAPDGFLRRVR